MPNSISRTAHSIQSLIVGFVFTMLKFLQDRLTKAMHGTEKVTSVESFYKIMDKNMKGETVNMSSFKDNVLLAVNVASN
jgi:hypothetical protein